MRGIDRARELRRAQTDAEALLWWRLRDRRLGGCKFRRQHAIGPFVADFVCPDRKLIMELDGRQHAERVTYDDALTAWLRARGYVVRRYWNDDVLVNVDSVLEDILMHLSPPVAATPHPDPLPARGERESRGACPGRCVASGHRGRRT